MGAALLLISAPEYWLGLIVLYLFAADIGQVKVFPGAGCYAGADQRPREMVHLADPAVARARRGVRGGVRAADARQPDRDDGPGLHPHRPRQGPARAPRRPAPRRARRDHADPDDLRARRRRAAGRRRADRDSVRHPRHRPSELRRDHPRRLPDHPGHGAARRAVHHRREHPRRHRLRLSRSAGSLL